MKMTKSQLVNKLEEARDSIDALNSELEASLETIYHIDPNNSWLNMNHPDFCEKKEKLSKEQIDTDKQSSEEQLKKEKIMKTSNREASLDQIKAMKEDGIIKEFDPTPVVKFYVLLAEASDAADDVDLFDLVGNDNESVDEFKKLCKKEKKRSKKLIKHILKHSKVLMKHLKTKDNL